MDPFLLPRAVIAWISFWWRLWTRLLGRRFMVTGLAITTLVTLVLIVRDSI